LYPRKWGNLSLWTWCKTYLLNGTQATVGERGSPDPLGSWVLHPRPLHVECNGRSIELQGIPIHFYMPVKVEPDLIIEDKK